MRLVTKLAVFVTLSGACASSIGNAAPTLSGDYSLFAIETCPTSDAVMLTTGTISFAGQSFTARGATAVNNFGSPPFQQSFRQTGSFKVRSEDEIVWDGINGVVSFGKAESHIAKSAVVQFLDAEANCDWQMTFQHQ